MTPAQEALDRLKEGNRDFVSDVRADVTLTSSARRSELAEEGQNPFAIILGCADSRVPSEMVFGQGVGDLFVIRVAGNIVDPSQLGSVEFAAEHFGTRLVVVMGHSKCGAILATFEELRNPAKNPSPNLSTIVNHIRPSVEPLIGSGESEDELVEKAVRANINASVEQLRSESEILDHLVREDGLLIIGAEYSLETGAVDFFDALPE